MYYGTREMKNVEDNGSDKQQQENSLRERSQENASSILQNFK